MPCFGPNSPFVHLSLSRSRTPTALSRGIALDRTVTTNLAPSRSLLCTAVLSVLLHTTSFPPPHVKTCTHAISHSFFFLSCFVFRFSFFVCVCVCGVFPLGRWLCSLSLRRVFLIIGVVSFFSLSFLSPSVHFLFYRSVAIFEILRRRPCVQLPFLPFPPFSRMYPPPLRICCICVY